MIYRAASITFDTREYNHHIEFYMKHLNLPKGELRMFSEWLIYHCFDEIYLLDICNRYNRYSTENLALKEELNKQLPYDVFQLITTCFPLFSLYGDCHEVSVEIERLFIVIHYYREDSWHHQ